MQHNQETYQIFNIEKVRVKKKVFGEVQSSLVVEGERLLLKDTSKNQAEHPEILSFSSQDKVSILTIE